MILASIQMIAALYWPSVSSADFMRVSPLYSADAGRVSPSCRAGRVSYAGLGEYQGEYRPYAGLGEYRRCTRPALSEYIFTPLALHIAEILVSFDTGNIRYPILVSFDTRIAAIRNASISRYE